MGGLAQQVGWLMIVGGYASQLLWGLQDPSCFGAFKLFDLFALISLPQPRAEGQNQSITIITMAHRWLRASTCSVAVGHRMTLKLAACAAKSAAGWRSWLPTDLQSTGRSSTFRSTCPVGWFYMILRHPWRKRSSKCCQNSGDQTYKLPVTTAHNLDTED